MSEGQSLHIINDGAVIRVESLTKTILVTKEQVKTIDTIQDNIVRLDIGEGPLKNIFINYQDVTSPVVGSAGELRDIIKEMMLSDQYDDGDATEQNQISILNRLGDIANILGVISAKEESFLKSEPSRLDEANPYMIYRGWHRGSGDPASQEWSLERIRRENDIIIHEWAHGSTQPSYSWNQRAELPYVPLNHLIR